MDSLILIKLNQYINLRRLRKPPQVLRKVPCLHPSSVVFTHLNIRWCSAISAGFNCQVSASSQQFGGFLPSPVTLEQHTSKVLRL